MTLVHLLPIIALLAPCRLSGPMNRTTATAEPPKPGDRADGPAPDGPTRLVIIRRVPGAGRKVEYERLVGHLSRQVVAGRTLDCFVVGENAGDLARGAEDCDAD